MAIGKHIKITGFFIDFKPDDVITVDMHYIEDDKKKVKKCMLVEIEEKGERPKFE